MGMDYIPVYEGEAEDGSTVKIAPGKLQRTGVRSESVSKRALFTSIHAPGVIQADEHRQAVVALRFDAFLNELEHITTGSKVAKGEPLMRVYSSALSAAAAAIRHRPRITKHRQPSPKSSRPAASREPRRPGRDHQGHRAQPGRLFDRHLARAA